MSIDNSAWKANAIIPWYLSWGFIIFMFIMAFPVAIVLTIKRTNLDNPQKKPGMVLKATGWVFIGLGMFYIIGALGDATSTLGNILSGAILFIGSGVIMVILSDRKKKNSDIYKKCLHLVIDQNIASIDNIAASIRTSYGTTRKYLQSMIDKGYFKDAYINDEAREIMLLHIDLEKIKKNSIPEQESIIVRCNGCGANNKVIKKSVGECEFCGSHIDGN